MGQIELHMVTVFSVIIASVTGAYKSLHLGRRVQHAFENIHKLSQSFMGISKVSAR